MEKYEAMRDSGHVWLGQIPKHWRMLRMKNVFEVVSERNHPDAEVLSLYREYGVLPKCSRDDNHNVTSEDTTSYKFVNVDDLVINKMKAWQGSLGISQYEGIVSPAYYVCRFINEDASKRYYHYLLRSRTYAQEFERLSTGMRVGQWDLGIDDFLSVPALIPPLDEQQAIAAYLDDQVAQIDSIIAEAQASIEDYKQWKLSIIHEAVTKGINADVPKRTTDISWIGEMPCSWQLIKVKRIVRIENGSDPQSEGDIPVYGSGAESFRTCGEYKEGPTVLLGRKGATLHIPHYIEGKYWNVDTAFNVVVINNMVNLKYFYYTAICFDYPAYRSQTTLPSMTQTNYNNMKVPYPDIITQNAIASFLDNKVAEIDDVISEKESLIADLESYKRSLIYEAVTGKRKVV